MIYGNIDIEGFKVLDDIWGVLKPEKARAYDWCKAAGIKPSRLSELRRLYLNKDNPEQASKVGRACTYEKLDHLTSGLVTMFGGDAVLKEMMKKLENTKNEKERCMIMLMLFKDKDISELRIIMEGMLRSAAYKK